MCVLLWVFYLSVPAVHVEFCILNLVNMTLPHSGLQLGSNGIHTAIFCWYIDGCLSVDDVQMYKMFNFFTSPIWNHDKREPRWHKYRDSLGLACFILWHHLPHEALSSETDLQRWTSSIIFLEIHAWLTETTVIQINPSWFYVLGNAIFFPLKPPSWQ